MRSQCRGHQQRPGCDGAARRGWGGWGRGDASPTACESAGSARSSETTLLVTCNASHAHSSITVTVMIRSKSTSYRIVSYLSGRSFRPRTSRISGSPAGTPDCRERASTAAQAERWRAESEAFSRMAPAQVERRGRGWGRVHVYCLTWGGVEDGSAPRVVVVCFFGFARRGVGGRPRRRAGRVVRGRGCSLCRP